MQQHDERTCTATPVMHLSITPTTIANRRKMSRDLNAAQVSVPAGTSCNAAVVIHHTARAHNVTSYRAARLPSESNIPFDIESSGALGYA